MAAKAPTKAEILETAIAKAKMGEPDPQPTRSISAIAAAGLRCLAPLIT
jgi:hypothetical protein